MKSLKLHLQNLLQRVALYDRLRASRVYDLYWMIADRRIIDARRAEVAFYRETLEGFKPGALVFDIGANEGYKTDVFLRMGASVVAVDPDQHNQDILRRKFLAYRLLKKPVVVVAKAVSDINGRATLWVDVPGSGKNTLTHKWVEALKADEHRFGMRLSFASQRHVDTVSLDSLIASHGVPFFIKIDVEGHEREVLRGLHRPVPFLSFEVNLPEFRLEGVECITRLATLASTGEFNYIVDSRPRLLLDQWLDADGFFPVFDKCTEGSIEIFWRSRAPVASALVR